VIKTQRLSFRKLRGRIIERYGILSKFAKAMGISSQTLSAKMNKKSGWTQDEIVRACGLLGIDIEREVGTYFFELEVQ